MLFCQVRACNVRLRAAESIVSQSKGRVRCISAWQIVKTEVPLRVSMIIWPLIFRVFPRGHHLDNRPTYAHTRAGTR